MSIHISNIREEVRDQLGPTSYPQHIAGRAGIGIGQGSLKEEEILALFIGTNIPSGCKIQLLFTECP